MILNIIKTYWVQILFFCTLLIGFYEFAKAMLESVKCSLRNDILAIYDRCKKDKKITKYQLEGIERSYTLYKSLKGNSFVDAIHEKVKKFDLID